MSLISTDKVMRQIVLDKLRRVLMYVGYDELGLVNLDRLRVEVQHELDSSYGRQAEQPEEQPRS